MKSGDILIQSLWNKALKSQCTEAILFWQEYDLDIDALLNWYCLN